MIMVIVVIIDILILIAMIFSVLFKNSKATYFFLYLSNIYTIISVISIIYILLDFYVEVCQNPSTGIGVIGIVLFGIPFYIFIVLCRVLTAAIARQSNGGQPVVLTKRLYWLSNVTAWSLTLPLIILAFGIVLPFI